MRSDIFGFSSCSVKTAKEIEGKLVLSLNKSSDATSDCALDTLKYHSEYCDIVRKILTLMQFLIFVGFYVTY